MLIPPVLEIFVVWHPDDVEGERLFCQMFGHFHGATYEGLFGGSVEVYERSSGWNGPTSPPRSILLGENLPNGMQPASVTVVVPILGLGLARACESDIGWRDYMSGLANAASAGDKFGLFSIRIDPEHTRGTWLESCISDQGLHLGEGVGVGGSALCRDLAHSIAGLIGDPFGGRLQIFISHTKRFSPDEVPDDVVHIVDMIRNCILHTHMSAYFDEADIQPGAIWEEELLLAASSSCLFVVRTDLYASRDWCQREMLAAKRADVPIVVLQALHGGESRGSYLMDHLPTVPLHSGNDDETRLSIELALDRLVDEALKRALWNEQRRHLANRGFDWLPSNAPEPTTVLGWLSTLGTQARDSLFVMHPDPPLGTTENLVIDELIAMTESSRRLEILTPRTFASRGGRFRS